MNRAGRCIAAALCVAGVAASPAYAQSKWNVPIPAVIAMAKDGVLVTVAPASFSGCQQGEALLESTLTVLPGLDLWSPVLVLDEGAPVWNMSWVNPGSGALNVKFHAEAWIRLLPYAGEQDLAEFLADPCAYYARTPLAEGLGRMSYTSADDSLAGPGANSWGINLLGPALSTTHCPSGTVRLSWTQRWVIRSATDFSAARLTAEAGPVFTCQ